MAKRAALLGARANNFGVQQGGRELADRAQPHIARFAAEPGQTRHAELGKPASPKRPAA